MSEAALEKCPTCGGPLTSRPAAPYPVLSQVLFGASFAAFLVATTVTMLPRPWLWAWTAAQVALGAVVVRGRLAARRRISRCIRCGEAVG